MDKKLAHKVQSLLDLEGYDSPDEILADYALESVVPGICYNGGCDYVGYYEPDQNRGWCENCENTTVVSLLYMLGVI